MANVQKKKQILKDCRAHLAAGGRLNWTAIGKKRKVPHNTAQRWWKEENQTAILSEIRREIGFGNEPDFGAIGSKYGLTERVVTNMWAKEKTSKPAVISTAGQQGRTIAPERTEQPTMHVLPPPQAPPPTADLMAKPNMVEPHELWLNEYRQLSMLIDGALAADRWPAAASFKGQSAKALAKYLETRPPERDLGDEDPEEVYQSLIEVARDMPSEHLEAIIRLYAEREELDIYAERVTTEAPIVSRMGDEGWEIVKSKQLPKWEG